MFYHLLFFIVHTFWLQLFHPFCHIICLKGHQCILPYLERLLPNMEGGSCVSLCLVIHDSFRLIMIHSYSLSVILTHSQSSWLILILLTQPQSFWLICYSNDSISSFVTHPHPYDLLRLTSDSIWLKTWVEASHPHDSLWPYVLGKFPRYLYKRTVFSSWKYNHFTLHNLPHLPLLPFARSLEQLSTLVEPKSLLRPSPSSTSLRQVRLGFD